MDTSVQENGKENGDMDVKKSVKSVSMIIISILNLFVKLYQKDAKKLTPMELALNVTKDIS
jgi:hypothetical protein